MVFRETIVDDVKEIMIIVKDAQNYFKLKGIDQWQNNYPNPQVFLDDISKNNSYVLEDDGQVVGTTMVSFEKDKTYEKIYNGEWKTEGKYGVIHRIAVKNKLKGKGVASAILHNVEEMCRRNNINSIRVDTHKENISMQKFLKKSDFEFCGIIYLEDGNERIAFEKIVKYDSK